MASYHNTDEHNYFRFWCIAIVLMVLFASKTGFFKAMEVLDDPILANKEEYVHSPPAENTRSRARERVKKLEQMPEEYKQYAAAQFN